MKAQNNLMQRIFQSKTRSSFREALQLPKSPKTYLSRGRTRRQPRHYVRGVKNGNYFRLRISEPHTFPPLRKLPPAANPIPKAFKQTGAPQTNVLAIKVASRDSGFSQRFFKWIKSNLPILGLNFGSICILVGFSRSDVLELRSLAMTGQILFAGYNLAQKTILWPSVAWSCLFSSVNGVKIFEILHERHFGVHMNEEQEELFVEHFMPHGVTPKQYEKIENKAKKFCLKKGKFLIRTGDKLDRVYLVCEGSTHAHIFGRRLSAQSTSKETKGDKKVGGDSGAWVGEMTFLETFGSKLKKNDNMELKQGKNGNLSSNLGISLYSVLADEDCTVMSWSHDELAELMKSSTDLRAALTRAMTSAIVGKVVNLTVSRKYERANNWSAWLSDWKYNDGARVQVRNVKKE